jgi:N4-gp56 family major capsid protein
MAKVVMKLYATLVAFLDLQLFAEAGTVTNTSTGSVNSYTGVATTSQDLRPGFDGHNYYNGTFLANARPYLIYGQLGKKEALPKNKSMTKEWHRWNKLAGLSQLTEGVIPEGQKLKETVLTGTIAQYGTYVTISDVLQMRSVDPVVQGATEELGAAASLSMEELTRTVLMANTNVLYGTVVKADGTVVGQATSRADMVTKLHATAGNHCELDTTIINLGQTILQTALAPFYSNQEYVAVIHPMVTFDLREDPDWIDVHKYAAPNAIFNGEIGKLHGVRFVQSTVAPIIEVESGNNTSKLALTMIFGKDAFGIIDPEGGSMQTIMHDKHEIGGPLDQFSTVGCKVETATKILYPERMITLVTSLSKADLVEANAVAA